MKQRIFLVLSVFLMSSPSFSSDYITVLTTCNFSNSGHPEIPIEEMVSLIKNYTNAEYMELVSEETLASEITTAGTSNYINTTSLFTVKIDLASIIAFNITWNTELEAETGAHLRENGFSELYGAVDFFDNVSLSFGSLCDFLVPTRLDKFVRDAQEQVVNRAIE